MNKQSVLPVELGGRMESWAGLRNLLVHLYLEIDSERLYEILQQDLNDREEYARAVSMAALD